ncbi:MAG: hypothetical protein V1708_02545 [Candidatus Micrarchaeota archaeon]
MPAKNPFGITPEMAREIAKETSKCMLDFKHSFIDKYGVNISNKLTSELVGKIFEVECERVLTKRLGYEVRKEKSDKEPDLFFTKINRPLEVKLTSTASAWTGGEFSKRPFDYVLVSWGGEFDEFFIALVHLEKKDWKSNFASNFYGPSYSAAKLHARKDKLVLMGSLEKTPHGAVKVVRENTG